MLNFVPRFRLWQGSHTGHRALFASVQAILFIFVCLMSAIFVSEALAGKDCVHAALVTATTCPGVASLS